MAKRFTKSSINWVEFEKKVPVDQKAKFFAFKAKSDGYLRRVLSHPPEPPKIDWAAYSKMVPIPGLVDKLKTEYEKFQVPYPQDTLSAKVDEQWKALEPEVKKFCADMQVEIDKATKELARIKSLPKYEEMTMQMYAEMFPDEALDPVNRPTYWPHTPDEQIGYVPPEVKAEKKK